MSRRRSKNSSARRAALRGGAAGVLVVGALVAGATPAAASLGDTDCHLGFVWPESQACLHRWPNKEHGVFGVWDNNAMGMSSADIANNGFITQTIYGFGNSPACGNTYLSYLEIGYTLGWHGQGGYRFYWIYNTPSQDFHFGSYHTASPNGSSHSYEVDADGSFSGWIDGDLVISLGVGVLPSAMCEAMAGLESNIGAFNKPTTWASENSITNLKWLDTADTWHSGWNTSQYWLDRPCGAQGYTPPNCFNGTYYGATEWASNKPPS